MFKIQMSVTKSYHSEPGKLIVEGVASDSTIDRDEERFDEGAVQKMLDCVNKGSIPIRCEHEDKFYSDIGVWKEATLDSEGKLYVKGEIDTEMSLGRDIETMLKRGMNIGLSVGGLVLDAVYQYCKELGRDIKVYKDVLLKEISVVKNPSNYSVSLSLAKSFNWTEKADKKKMGYKKWFQDVESKIDELVDKCLDCMCEGPCEMSCCNDISQLDIQTMAQLVTILSTVELPQDSDIPELLNDPNYYNNIHEEHMIVLFSREMVMPHHNLDYSVNKELVLYQMKALVDYGRYYTPKDYSVCLTHLFRHLKELNLITKGTSTKEMMIKRYSPVTV